VAIEISPNGGPGVYQLARGEELILKLPENPTTGYRWEIRQTGAGELRPVDDRLVPGAGSMVPGAAGERVMRFTGQRAGEVQIEALLRRSWSAPDESTERRLYSITIR
jgi:inhibitor of cysteine peptidase